MSVEVKEGGKEDAERGKRKEERGRKGEKVWKGQVKGTGARCAGGLE